MDRYFVEFNGAYNGNENWAPGLKFGFFPSGAVGWLVSEENFMKNNLPFIEYFKIRYSYGIVGSDSGIGGNRFTYMSQFDTGNGGVITSYSIHYTKLYEIRSPLNTVLLTISSISPFLIQELGLTIRTCPIFSNVFTG